MSSCDTPFCEGFQPVARNFFLIVAVFVVTCLDGLPKTFLVLVDTVVCPVPRLPLVQRMGVFRGYRVHPRAGKNLRFFKCFLGFSSFLGFLGVIVRRVARGTLDTGIWSRRRPIDPVADPGIP